MRLKDSSRKISSKAPFFRSMRAEVSLRMLAFHREYPQRALVPQPVAPSGTAPVVPQAVALFEPQLLQAIPWGHHAELMAKVKDSPTRHWYMQAPVQHGWSRNILVMRIESVAHQRQGRTVSNFARRLPAPDSDLVHQARQRKLGPCWRSMPSCWPCTGIFVVNWMPGSASALGARRWRSKWRWTCKPAAPG